MITKTVRSRFSHEVGEKVEGCTILERRVVIPPQPSERRLGVYDYVVEVPPAPAPKARQSHTGTPSRIPPREAGSSTPEKGSFTRSTPEDMASRLIRRVPSR